MKFFIPVTKSRPNEEEIYLYIKKLVSKTTGASISDRRIFKLELRQEEKQISVEVGMNYPSTEDKVHAIFYDETRKMYCICTTKRGLEKQLPIIFGQDEVISYEDFET